MGDMEKIFIVRDAGLPVAGPSADNRTADKKQASDGRIKQKRLYNLDPDQLKGLIEF
jgi:hypothetical protein